MNTDIALFWVQDALQTAFLIATPLLGVALIIGVVVSLIQALTSMQEMTLSYIPKMLAVGIILLVLTPWMLEILTDFAVRVITYIPQVSR
ncbi:MAG: flagellar biosynthesis protein FliQ [Rhodothermales bacterium]